VSFSLSNLSVRHAKGAHVLRDLNLTIGSGEQVALIGPSGAGKTTLLHTLACAHRPDAGQFKALAKMSGI
jgi:phosphonate transport system ATP-binding protein